MIDKFQYIFCQRLPVDEATIIFNCSAVFYHVLPIDILYYIYEESEFVINHQ